MFLTTLARECLRNLPKPLLILSSEFVANLSVTVVCLQIGNTKKGQKYDPANYRTIGLTYIASKVMEHVICSNLMQHTSRNSIFYGLQHGFRDRRSCETQLLEFVQDIVTNMQDGAQSDVCVLDVSKAFDKVGHQRLVEKLKWYGIRGSVNHWIADFLKNRTQSVVIEGVCHPTKYQSSQVYPKGPSWGVSLPVLHKRHRRAADINNSSIC